MLKISKKLSRKLLFIFLGCCTLLILYSVYGNGFDKEYSSTYDYECIRNGSPPHPHIVHYCIPDNQIYFVETAEAPKLNPRQACAVESTARSNPSMPISVLMTSPTISDSDPLMREIMKLPNVAFHPINIDVFFHGTPMWDWFRAGKWRKSKWMASHMSDALRFFIIWKYGGAYLDLDIVTFRSLENLRNCVITGDWTGLNSGMLFFDKGHEVMRLSVKDFISNYDPYDFAANGPIVIARTIKTFCKVQDIGKVSGSGCSVDVLPPDTAFPIPWDEWEKYFEPIHLQKNVSSHFSTSYMIHVWNKSSSKGKVFIGSQSLYERAIKENCPIVYDYARQFRFI